MQLSNEEQNKKVLDEEIKPAYKKGNLIPFIGAGFSKNISGYPGWKKFIKKLEEDSREKIDLMGTFKGNTLEATEYYIWKKVEELENDKIFKKSDTPSIKFNAGKQKLLDVIENMVKENTRNQHNNHEWQYHDLMVNKFNYIYTTNWDNTLESAKPKNGKEIKAIYRKSHLSDIDYAKDCKKVIKFHGHWEDIAAEPLIACQKDYNKRILEENPFDIKLKNDLLHNNFFFIGYNFGDPNILLMIDLIYQIIEEVESRVKVFWISTENFGDHRVELLKKSLEIEPYYLLTTKDQQNELNTLKKELEKKCDNCLVNKKTNLNVNIFLELCGKCDESEKEKFQSKKKELIEKQTGVFLNNFVI